jgi:hypothetical protein
MSDMGRISIKSKHSWWGSIVYIEQGIAWRAVIHPEHAAHLVTLRPGESYDWTDEQGDHWELERPKAGKPGAELIRIERDGYRRRPVTVPWGRLLQHLKKAQANKGGEAPEYVKKFHGTSSTAETLRKMHGGKRRKPKKAGSGYRPCACRDCMEIAIGGPGAYCHECVAAGCPDYQGQPGMSQECQAMKAYGGEDPIEEHEFLSARHHRGGKRRHAPTPPSRLTALVADINRMTK